MPATVFASAGGRKYHFGKGCKAFESGTYLNDWDCEGPCYGHTHARMYGLVRMSSTKAAVDGKLPCLACVPEHLRELHPAEAFGHEPFEYDGVPICIRCFIQHRGWRETVAWPCTSAIVLGLVPRPTE